MKKTIKINNNDNVIIALEELYPGDKYYKIYLLDIK